MKKELYSTPHAWVVPMCMETVLCGSDTSTGGSGENLDPWTGDNFTAPLPALPIF